MHKACGIVLDIDETLVHSYDNLVSYDYFFTNHRKKFSEFHYSKKIKKLDISGMEDPEDMWTVKRPYVDEFINYVTEVFDYVIIWSAGQKRYVDEIVDFLFTDRMPDAVYSRDFLKTNPYGNTTKPLSKIYKTFGDLNEKNTILVDNLPSNFSKQDLGNCIQIHDFEPDVKSLVDDSYNNDTCLRDLCNWFDSIFYRRVKDIRHVDKTNIFEPM